MSALSKGLASVIMNCLSLVWSVILYLAVSTWGIFKGFGCTHGDSGSDSCSLKPWIRSFLKCPGDSVMQPLVLRLLPWSTNQFGAQEVFSSVCVKFVITDDIQVGREKLVRSGGWRPGDSFNQHSITSQNPKNELLSLSREMKIQGRPGLEACLACLRQFLCSVEILKRYGWSPGAGMQLGLWKAWDPITHIPSAPLLCASCLSLLLPSFLCLLSLW